MKLYRFLSDDDAIKGEMRCGQLVVKEKEGAYSPELNLGEQ